MKTCLRTGIVAALPALLSIFHPQLSAAPLGNAFTYQGRLNDGGQAATGIYDLRFAIFDAAANGSAVGGVLTNAATPVTNGLFTVPLDFGAVFDGDARWLEIGVRSNGSEADFSTLSPRLPLTPAPYALHALGYSGPVAASQLTGTISSSHIGTGSITTDMLAAGSVGSNQLADHTVTTSALADGAVTAAKVATASNWFALTIANPTPAVGDFFGDRVAAVGTDRVLIGAAGDDTGAEDAGAAYLISTSGALLTTFTNPTPGIADHFGISVAAVGTNRVLIGAHEDDTGANNAGAAYLFSSNGALLTAFTNPTPAAGDWFGFSVAAVGTDMVLIGAGGDDTGAGNSGAAYLFSLTGTLLTTFTNPTPAAGDYFGWSVAAVGIDRVLMGAHLDDTGALQSGAAYLFSTNGALLTTFTNPTPGVADNFGIAVTAVGTNRVLIGAYGDSTGASVAGAAYLFSMDGTLLTAFTKPAPAVGDFFGNSVAAVGTDRVLIGAYGDDTGAPHAGAVYLFSTNGALLTTFTNPAPATSDLFGASVAVMGSDHVLVGAPQDDTGAQNAGAAYLFSLATYAPGLVTERVTARSITTASLEDGAVTAAKIGGVLFANQIPELDASKLASGTLADARLSTNVARLNANQVFTGSNRFTGVVELTNAANSLTGSFHGNGQGLTNLNTTNLTGMISGMMLAAGAVSSNELADGAVTAAKVATLTLPWFQTILTNPTPAGGDGFGSSVAGVGTDRVLIGAHRDDWGAEDAGAAYLFSMHGALLTTFTNPTPAANDYFGISVAAVGPDRVLIGAVGDSTGVITGGAAYLFRADGTLLVTFTNPNPTPPGADNFGIAVAAVGTDRVLIGAYGDDLGAGRGTGAAYLFRTDGALLTTFTNSTPAVGDNFGIAVAAVGTDQVLIGAQGDNPGTGWGTGAAYLFDTNGALLTTFTNPTPAIGDYFGRFVAAVGTDRVLIGAYWDDMYLFSTKGALLTTFTIPTPADNGWFGFSGAAVGTDRVLIGALFDDTVAGDAGAAYLFSTNGALLATLTNPSPTAGDYFGRCVAAVGEQRVLIGASQDNTSAGMAYLFSLETFTPGLIAEGVRDGSINTPNLAEGAVTPAKLDPTIGVWTRAGEDVFRLAGNVGIGTSSFTSNRLEVAGMVGATAFNTLSDRAGKQDFTPVDPQAVLAKVAALPLTQWRFKDYPDALHLGPMAQDFRAAFGLGVDDQSIATVDADGVALAAIQGLNAKVELRSQRVEARSQELKEQLQRKDQEIAELRQAVNDLKALVQSLNAKLDGGRQ